MLDMFGNPEDRFSRVAAHVTNVKNKTQETTCPGDNLKSIWTCPSSFEFVP